MRLIKNGIVILLLLVLSFPLCAGKGHKPAPLNFAACALEAGEATAPQMNPGAASFSPVNVTDEAAPSQMDPGMAGPSEHEAMAPQMNPHAGSFFEQAPDMLFMDSLLADPFIQGLAEHFGIPNTITFVGALGGLDLLTAYVEFVGGLESFITYAQFAGGLEALMGHMQVEGGLEELIQYVSSIQQNKDESVHVSGSLDGALAYLNTIGLLEPIIQEAIEGLRIASNPVPNLETLDDAIAYLQSLGALEGVIGQAMASVEAPAQSMPFMQAYAAAMQVGFEDISLSELTLSPMEPEQASGYFCFGPPVTPTSERGGDQGVDEESLGGFSTGRRNAVVLEGAGNFSAAE